MLELSGKYNSCRVFTDSCEEGCLSQLRSLLDQECSAGSRIRIMPDCHAGVGCVIGTTMTITDKVVPNLVGVDIGCGVLTVRLEEKRIDLPKLDSVIRSRIPYGFAVHDKPAADVDLSMLRCAKHVDIGRAQKSLGTLGGGNHFLEIDRDDEGNLYLVIHTGSRHLGIEVCGYYQDAAYESLRQKAAGSLPELTGKLVEKLKSEGREKEISRELARLKAEYKKTVPAVPHELAYLTGQLLDNYLHDMKITQEFASQNRFTIARILLKAMKLHETGHLETIHNYVDTRQGILRKGAVSAQEGEELLIPINMRDGSLLCVGKGNEDWNFSAPHGAGRLLSRKQAKESITMRDFRETMAGIYTTSVGPGTVDESPMAYKPMEEILRNITDTVEVRQVIRPIYSFKAPSEPR